MDKEKEFIKNIKPQKRQLVAAIIIFAICASLEYVAYNHLIKTKENAFYLGDATKENQYVCLDTTMMTDYFATYTGGEDPDEKIYFLFDENYMYMANITEKELERLQPIMDYTYRTDEDNLEEPEPVRVCGTTKLIDNNLKKLAIDYYNEIFETEFLTSSNFENYLTEFYIDTNSKIDEDLIWQSVLIGIFALFGILLLYTHFKNAKTTRKTLSEYANDMEKIKSDIASPETTYEKSAKLYLTKDYIINLACGFEIYKYDDIVWFYPHEVRQNGFVTQKSIYVVTKDSKVHVVANLSTSKKNNVKFEEIYHSLLIKAPKALQGYTEENKEKAKSLYIK